MILLHAPSCLSWNGHTKLRRSTQITGHSSYACRYDCTKNLVRDVSDICHGVITKQLCLREGGGICLMERSTLQSKPYTLCLHSDPMIIVLESVTKKHKQRVRGWGGCQHNHLQCVHLPAGVLFLLMFFCISGCGQTLPLPYSENPFNSQGMKLGLYRGVTCGDGH